MSDWAVGDLAACINKGGWIDGSTGKPAQGMPYGWVGQVIRVWDQVGSTMLVFETGNPHGYSARQFRKIRPDEHGACEPEFVTLLKRTKRKVSA